MTLSSLSSRPLWSKSTDELESLLRRSRRDLGVLRQLKHELEYRRSNKAIRLLGRVTRKLENRGFYADLPRPVRAQPERRPIAASKPESAPRPGASPSPSLSSPGNGRRESAQNRKPISRQRSFSLPAVDDLTKEQTKAIYVPVDGQHLVVGGPGTGKTVVALLRARRHTRNDDDYMVLVWNHLLHMATTQLFTGKLSSDTWESWLAKQYRNRFSRALPRVPREQGETYRRIDWQAVVGETEDIDPAPKSLCVVIDEGQDMPSEFYTAIRDMGFDRLFVAADQNQQITDQQHSSREDIEVELDLEAEDVILLRQNYRNTGPIAKLARCFFTKDPASPPPNIPDVAGETARLVYYSRTNFLDRCAEIVRLADIHPSYLIGVLTPNDRVRKKYVCGLEKVDVQLDHDRCKIQTFFGQYRPLVRFDRGGILVINSQACKGLEFDIAVLADIDEHFAPTTDLLKKRFYVMVARARRQVILLRERYREKREINDILPINPNLLKREGD